MIEIDLSSQERSGLESPLPAGLYGGNFYTIMNAMDKRATFTAENIRKFIREQFGKQFLGVLAQKICQICRGQS